MVSHALTRGFLTGFSILVPDVYYFRFLTLLGLSIFLAQQLDVVVLEVGIGGRLDATNGGRGCNQYLLGGWSVRWVGRAHA